MVDGGVIRSQPILASCLNQNNVTDALSVRFLGNDELVAVDVGEASIGEIVVAVASEIFNLITFLNISFINHSFNPFFSTGQSLTELDIIRTWFL